MTHALFERKIKSIGIILQCYWGGFFPAVNTSVLAPCSFSFELICSGIFYVRPLTQDAGSNCIQGGNMFLVQSSFAQHISYSLHLPASSLTHCAC